nr:BatD family protein [uncultured Arsenicibacter sp.]
MNIAIFIKNFVLFFCVSLVAFSQSADNIVTIELSQSTFPIERPFTITVQVRNSETRPNIVFPDIPGFAKRATSISTTNVETGDKTTTNQIITQSYMANQPGTYRLAPFSINANGFVARSEGATLVVRAPAAAGDDQDLLLLPTESGTAFLAVRPSKGAVYVGEGLTVRLSLFVADNYPFELAYWQLDQQIQAITKQLHPPNTWEENANLKEIQTVPILINGRRFTEHRLYQATFFPLSAQPIKLPSITLQMRRIKPSAGAARPAATNAELFSFISRPMTVAVKPLPPHPMSGQIAVGKFRLAESIERSKVDVGKSTRYSFRIEGEGNIASLQAPNVQDAANDPDNPTILPAGTSQSVNRNGYQINGYKSFDYFLMPRQALSFPLKKVFFWVYFDPGAARYDTLRSAITVQAGGSAGQTAAAGEAVVIPSATAEAVSIYTGLSQLDSSKPFINIPAIIRAIANVILIVMIIGMIFVLFRR